MQSVLVTGVTGYTGYRLADRLVRQGCRVRGLVRSESLRQKPVPQGVEVVEGDIRRPVDVDGAVAGVDVVFHLAALYRTARHTDHAYWQVNVEGTRNILQAVQQHATQRLVHCSTIGVHGDVQRIPSDESAEYRPGDVYQTTKLEGELLVQEAIADGAPAVIVRPAGIYGPGDRRFLKLFQLIKSRRFHMIGDGQTLFHPIYIEDLIDGFRECASSDAALGETYILAGPRFVTLNELCRMVADVFQVRLRHGRIPYPIVWATARLCETLCRRLAIEPPLHRRRVEFFVKNRAFCTDKARREIDFTPATELESGLLQTSEWYQQHGWL